MRREDVADVFARLPDVEHARVHVVMASGPSVSIDTVMRLEPAYAVIRGREAGNQDEGRIFFLPFEAIVYLKLERVVKATELDEWFRDTEPMVKRPDAEPSDALTETPPPAPEHIDPAEIARRNLLERLRAARSVINRK